VYSSSELRARTANLENTKDNVNALPQHSPDLLNKIR